jgi:hypothetical protein
MAALVDAMRPRQQTEAAHAAEKLTGPDPARPAEAVTRPVSWWFEQPTPALMRALADPGNGWITPGNASTSRFVTDLLRGHNAMSRALRGRVPGGDGRTWAEVATAWIDAGCPLLPDPPAVRPLTLLTPPERVATHPTGQIHGTGSVH